MTFSCESSARLAINDTQCVGCAICADVCLTDALVMGRDDWQPVWRWELCTGCGDCVPECPTGAIRLNPEPAA